MPRLMKYLGPADIFDSGSLFDKTYTFTSPGEKDVIADDGTRIRHDERGAAVAVNNDHAAELLTLPRHRFAEVEEEAAPAD